MYSMPCRQSRVKEGFPPPLSAEPTEAEEFGRAWSCGVPVVDAESKKKTSDSMDLLLPRPLFRGLFSRRQHPSPFRP